MAMRAAARMSAFVAGVLAMVGSVSAQQSARPWQEITVPTVAQAAANFKSPPHEYGAIQAFQSWNGADVDALKLRITADLDRMQANGMFIINLAPGRRGPGE